MIKPNERTKTTLASTASDIDEIAEMIKQQLPILAQLSEALRAGDYRAATDLLDACRQSTQSQHVFAHVVNAKMQSIEVLQPDLYDSERTSYEERRMRKHLEGLDVDEVRAEAERHSHCEPGCPHGKVIAERLRELEAH